MAPTPVEAMAPLHRACAHCGDPMLVGVLLEGGFPFSTSRRTTCSASCRTMASRKRVAADREALAQHRESESRQVRTMTDRTVTVREPRACGLCRGQINGGELARYLVTRSPDGIVREWRHFGECNWGGNDVEWRDRVGSDVMGGMF